MKSITVSLPPEVEDWVRKCAAVQDTSLSAVVGTLLCEAMEREQSYAESMSSYLAREPQDISGSSACPSKDDLHAR
jgi:hypothetical protein